MTVTTGPCSNWIDETYWGDPGPDNDCAFCGDATFSQVARYVGISSELLFALSGFQFPGICASGPIRPAHQLRDDPWSANVFGSFGWVDSWGYWPSSMTLRRFVDQTNERTGSGDAPEITLGVEPLVAITSCKIDGQSFTNYRIDDERWLVRTDGRSWPLCQNPTLSSTEPNTFEVECQFGVAPPGSGQFAAAVLACELWKAKCGDKACRLPARVQSITRQNASAVLVNPADFIDKGRTGIPEIDVFLKAANPDGLRGSAKIYSPDILPVRRPGA